MGHTLDRLVQQPGKLIKLNCQRINERMIRSDHDRDFPSPSLPSLSSSFSSRTLDCLTSMKMNWKVTGQLIDKAIVQPVSTLD